MVNQINPSELQLNKASTSDTEAPFLDLHLSITNGFVSSKINVKRDDFNFDIVNFPFFRKVTKRMINTIVIFLQQYTACTNVTGIYHQLKFN